MVRKPMARALRVAARSSIRTRSAGISGEDDGFALAGIEFLSEQLNGEGVLRGLDGDPVGSGGERGKAGFVFDFGAHGGRDDDRVEQLAEQVELADVCQREDGAGVGDDSRHGSRSTR